MRFWHIVFLLALTFFLKVNFFVVTLGAFVLQCILYRRLRKEIIWGFLTFALALLVLDVFTGMIRGYLRDIGLAAAVNQGAIIPLLAKAFSEYFWVFMPAVALLGVQGLRVVDRILRHIRSTRSPLRLMLGAARPWLLCGYVIAGTLLSESQNLGGIGPMPLAALFFAPRLSTRGLMARLANVTGLLIPVFALVPWLWVIAGTGACIGRQVLLQRSFAPITDIAPDFPEFAAHRRVIADQYTSARLEADRRLRDWVLHRDPRLYVFYFREMSALLAAIRADYGASLPPTRTLDFADPVPALLGSKPAPGAYIALHYLRTISDVSYIPAETYFSGIALVFVPRCALFELNEAMVDLYRPYLKLNFRRRALTPCWDVYERGSPAEVF